MTSTAIPIDQYAQQALATYQQQQGIRTGQSESLQVSAEDQARFIGSVGKWFADNVLPTVMQHAATLLSGQQRALGIPETRGGDEEQRFLLDFAKKALKVVVPVAQQALQNLLAPRQREINVDGSTEDRFAFLAPFIPALIGAAGSALGGLLSGQRGPLQIDDEQDRLILSQFTTNCWSSLLDKKVVNSLPPVLAAVQRPSNSSRPAQPVDF